MTKLPFAVSVPHGGTEIPFEFASQVITTPECTREDVDHFTKEICGVDPDRILHFLSFDIGRTYLDLNRPPEAFGEAYPDGVVKRKTHLGRSVFRQFPSDETVGAVIDRLYRPYHEKLREIVNDPEVRLTLDCHSMSPVGLADSPDAPGELRPAICLGHKGGETATAETVEALRQVMAQVYELPLSEITIDKPFNGGYITRTYGTPQKPVIQIEFSRGFYMKDQLGRADPKMEESDLRIWRGRFTETLERLAKAPIFR